MSYAATQTTNKYHCELPRYTQIAMRAAFRRGVKKRSHELQSDDLSADIVLEEIWNAAMGNF